MDERLPALKSKDVIRVFKKANFYIHHQTGSHVLMRHKTDKGKRVTVPVHNRDLKRGTLHSILKQAGLTTDSFLKLL